MGWVNPGATGAARELRGAGCASMCGVDGPAYVEGESRHVLEAEVARGGCAGSGAAQRRMHVRGRQGRPHQTGAPGCAARAEHPRQHGDQTIRRPLDNRSAISAHIAIVNATSHPAGLGRSLSPTRSEDSASNESVQYCPICARPRSTDCARDRRIFHAGGPTVDRDCRRRRYSDDFVVTGRRRPSAVVCSATGSPWVWIVDGLTHGVCGETGRSRCLPASDHTSVRLT